MNQAFVVTGALQDGRTVTLDEALPFKDGKVRVTVEIVTATSRQSYTEFMADLRASQAKRGHVAPTREEVDAYLRAERDSWGD